MAAAAKATDERVTLGALARESLDKASGDTTAATEALVARLLSSKALLRAVIANAVADAVSYRVEMSMRTRRRDIVAATTGPGRAGVVSLARGLTMALLDMPLANGVRLRDASRAQVVEQATRYERQAADMGRKARWLTIIAQSTPPDRKVGEVLTDARAAELWNEVA